MGEEVIVVGATQPGWASSQWALAWLVAALRLAAIESCNVHPHNNHHAHDACYLLSDHTGYKQMGQA